MVCDPRDIKPGDQLGAYRIDEVLGQGGMAMVFRGHDLRLQRRVAIKVMFPEFAQQTGGRERFLREGRAAASLEHPNVVYMLDVNVEGDMPYFVMEYLVGEDVRALLQREGKLTVEHAASIIAPVARALSAAHRLGIVHRDLKPENIFLARQADGAIVPKVLDFGISRVESKLLQDERVVTATGMLLGTPHYMSPEQVHGAKLAIAASDQYSLGVVLYELLTGTKPFEAESLFALLSNIVNGGARPPRELCPELPAAIELVVRRAMHGDAGQRYGDVAMFADALEAVRSPVVGPGLAHIARETRRLNVKIDISRRSVPSLDTPRAGTSLPVVLPRNRFPWGLAAAGALCACMVVALTLKPASEPDTRAFGAAAATQPGSPQEALPAVAPLAPPPEVKPADAPASSVSAARGSAGPTEVATRSKRHARTRTGRLPTSRVASREVRVGANDSIILDAP